MKRLLLLLLMAAAPAAADDFGLPLRSGDPVTILRVDGGREEARFVGTAEDPPRLLLAKPQARSWGSGWQQEVPLDGIARLEANGAADFKERRILVSTLLGMVVGGAIAFIVHDPQQYAIPAVEPSSGDYPTDDTRIESTVQGMAAGSILGGLAGFFIAPSHGPARAWTFPDGHSAVSETGQTPR